MPITFLNLAMLAGLTAVVIPPLIHLLNRRRYDVVAWGAMQFLEVSQRTRRRVFLEEVILMLARMALIALMVVALAAPQDSSRWLDFLADRGARDVVLVVDGSASMGYRSPGGTAHDAAKVWVNDFLATLNGDDAVAVIHARQRPVSLVAEPTHDFDAVRTAVQTLLPPRGGCDGPAAVAAALQMRTMGGERRRDVFVLTDGQRHGWTDDAALAAWEPIGRKSDGGPRIWVVNLDPDRPPDPPNRSVAPIRAGRAVASVGQQVAFETAIQRRGQPAPSFGRPRLLVDGKAVGELPSAAGAAEKEQPLTVRHRFVTPGSHLVTVQTEADALPADDRRDFALEVLPQLPVLLVDGDPNAETARRGSDFLRDALAPARDPHPAVLIRVVSVRDLDEGLMSRDLAGPGTNPRVVVLCNVANVTPAQDAAIATFLNGGGGLLIAPGDRADAETYSRSLYRGGRGWLPASVSGPVDMAANAARPEPSSFAHPALELFREPQPGGVGDARFPTHWKLTAAVGSPSRVAARLNDGDPFLVEKAFGEGRVLQTCVPLDGSWGTNQVELPAFAPLAHEIVYYLAGGRSAETNLAPGQVGRYRLPKGAPTVGWAVQSPDGPQRPVGVSDGEIRFVETTEPGVYTLRDPAGAVARYFVVQPDAGESDLSPWTDAERDRIRQVASAVDFASDPAGVVADVLRAPNPADLWWVVMAGVVVLLASELWLTRRRALAAGV